MNFRLAKEVLLRPERWRLVEVEKGRDTATEPLFVPRPAAVAAR
jgi:hypothetical protein